jgi:hypothetical protein
MRPSTKTGVRWELKRRPSSRDKISTHNRRFARIPAASNRFGTEICGVVCDPYHTVGSGFGMRPWNANKSAAGHSARDAKSQAPNVPRLTEDELIARIFAPIAGPAGLGLRDDAAPLKPPSGDDLALTTDALVEGVHFFADDPPDAIAPRLA